MRTEPAAAWLAGLRESGGQDDLATLAFFDQIDQIAAAGRTADLNLGPVRHDHLTQSLTGSDMVCPPVDRAEVHRCLGRCVERGLLPAPAEATTVMTYASGTREVPGAPRKGSPEIRERRTP